MLNAQISTDILVVDDSADLRTLLAIVLMREGMTTDQAESGEAAIRRLRQKSFRLVVSDVDMENGNGLWLLKKIQTEMPSLPVVLMSGGAIDEKTAIRSGASGFLKKPFSLSVVQKTVCMALKSGRK